MKFLLWIGLVLLLMLISSFVGYRVFLAVYRRPKDPEKDFRKIRQRLLESCGEKAEDWLAAGARWLKETPYEEVSIKSFDSFDLHGRFYEAPSPCGRTAILLHGYHSSPELDLGPQAAFLYGRGMNVLVTELRAHGDSQAIYSTLGVAERYDAMDWATWVREKMGPQEGVIFYGFSLGGTAALMTTSSDELPENVIGVIAECAYISPQIQLTAAMQKRHIPVMLFGNTVDLMCMMKGRFSIRDCTTTNAMPRCQVPVLLLHGMEDKLVSPDDSRINAEQCAAPSRWVPVPGAGHGGCFLAEPQLCEEAVAAFLDSLEGPPSPFRRAKDEEGESADLPFTDGNQPPEKTFPQENLLDPEAEFGGQDADSEFGDMSGEFGDGAGGGDAGGDY